MAEKKWMWQLKCQIGNSDPLLMLQVPSCKHNSSTCKSFFWLQAYQPIGELKMLFPWRIKGVDWSRCENWLISLEMSGGGFRGTPCRFFPLSVLWNREVRVAAAFAYFEKCFCIFCGWQQWQGGVFGCTGWRGCWYLRQSREMWRKTMATHRNQFSKGRPVKSALSVTLCREYFNLGPSVWLEQWSFLDSWIKYTVL